MNEHNEAKASVGRPKNDIDIELLTLRLDPITLRMLEALRGYGRFGATRQEIILYILRSWLWENEPRLKTAIASKDKPLGPVPSESD